MRATLTSFLVAVALAVASAQTPPCSGLWLSVQAATALADARTDGLKTTKKPTASELSVIEAAEAQLLVSESAFAVAGCVVPDVPPPPPQPPPSGALVQQSNLVYQGYFDSPPDWAYSGHAISYNPVNHSLYMTFGQTGIGEITIPALGSAAVDIEWNADPADGVGVGTGGVNTYLGGTLPFGGRLWFTKYLYYDTSNEQTHSHFSRSLDLPAVNQSEGPHRVGPLKAGFYSGYMAHVPLVHQAVLGGPVLTGQCCLSIITRTSFGPAAFAIDPAAIVEQDAIPLVYYPQEHPTLGPYSAASQFYGGSDTVTGLAVPDTFASVLFFGEHGTTFCYGTGPECNDPINPYQSNHGYPYEQSVWAYAIADLAAVNAGTKQPWEVVPYARWVLPDLAGKRIIGAAYDPATQRVFVSVYKGGPVLRPDNPRIHVYQVTP